VVKSPEAWALLKSLAIGMSRIAANGPMSCLAGTAYVRYRTCNEPSCFVFSTVFEQTLQFCIREELADHGLYPDAEEQVAIGGRAKADLRLAHILLEVKARGLFGMSDVQKYGRYQERAEAQNYRYLFVTASETYEPYRRGIIDTLGHSNVFILAVSGDWERLVTTIVQELNCEERFQAGIE
jgi:hypothetical protein